MEKKMIEKESQKCCDTLWHSFHDLAQNKAPFPSTKGIYLSPIFKKKSPNKKQKQNKQAKLSVFYLK